MDTTKSQYEFAEFLADIRCIEELKTSGLWSSPDELNALWEEYSIEVHGVAGHTVFFSLRNHAAHIVIAGTINLPILRGHNHDTVFGAAKELRESRPPGAVVSLPFR